MLDNNCNLFVELPQKLMIPDSQQSHSLQKLIQLKRWEMPPPGHLDRLSSRVIAQIEADAVSKGNLWTTLGEIFDFKPFLACALCVVAMGLLLSGLGMKVHPVPSSRIPLIKNLTIEGTPSAKAASFSQPRLSLWRGNFSLAGNRSIHPVDPFSVSVPASILRKQFPSNSPASVSRMLPVHYSTP